MRNRARTSVYLALGSGTFSAPINGPSIVISALSLNHARFDRARVHMGDFDGDGKTDLMRLNGGGSSDTTVYLSNGNGSFTSNAWAALSVGNDSVTGWARVDLSRVLVADFNGDGKTDVMRLSGDNNNNGLTWVCLSRGDGNLTCTVGPWIYISHGSTDLAYFDLARVKLGDFNGDGLTDLWRLDGWASGGTSVFLAKGEGSFMAAVAGPPAWVGSDSPIGWARVALDRVRLGAFYGNGRTDTFRLDGLGSSGTTMYRVDVGTLAATAFRNGLGGETTVSYTPSSAWANNNNLPTVPTVTAVTINDGRGTSATSTYSYSGGQFDQLYRRFLGFGYVKETVPCITGETQCPYKETWFSQTYGSVAQPYRTDMRAGNGTLLTSKVDSYTTNGATVPHTSLNTTTWVYAYDGTGISCSSWPCAHGRRTVTTRTFDAYSNQLTENSYGDYDVSGDERRIELIYRPNPAYYIVGLPAVKRQFYLTAASTWELLEEALVTYDGRATWDAAPFKGLPTKTLRLVTTTPSYVEVRQEYDSYGNLTAEIAPGERRTGYVYDTTYHIYRTEKRSPLYYASPADTRHRETYVTDPVCGAQTQKTAASGLVTTYQYDALCRPTRTDDSSGYFEIHSYHSLGSATAQYQQLQTPAADSTGNLWARKYLDGLGRQYKLETKGAPLASYKFVEYTQRGKVARVCAPYFAGATAKWTTASYDALDRVTRATNPDGSFETRSYGLGAMTATDALGHQRTEWVDALGRVTARRQWRGGTALDTTYEYNVRGQATRITDPAGNVYQVAYNAAGLRSSYVDPDRGTTSFEYDPIGQLTAAVSPLGRVEYGYDLIGRKTSQVEKQPSGTVEQTITLRYDERAGEPYAYTYTYSYTKRWSSPPYGIPACPCDISTTVYDCPSPFTLVEDRGETCYDTAGSYDKIYVRTEVATTHNVGALTSMTDALGTSTLDYDVKGNLVRATRVLDGVSYTFQHGYDAGGRVLWSTYPDGDTLGTPTNPRTYDGVGRPKTIPGYVTNVTYNAAGQPLTMYRANGTSTNYTYDVNRGWLTGLGTVNGYTTIQNLGYTRDALGRVTQQTSPFAGESWSYGYDTLGQLTAATGSPESQTWGYDNTGNLTSVGRPSSLGGGTWSYTYNSAHGPASVRPHAVVQAGANTYAYDAGGNMVSGAGRTMTWGVNGLPQTVNADSFAYDGNGVRVKKVAGGVTTYYVAGDYEVKAGSAGVVTKYVHFGKELVAKKVGAVSYHLHTDALGSVQAVTDASGAEVQRLKHRPYGERLATATGHEQGRGFTGQVHDESGLIYLHARYYDPALGRFISADQVIPTGDVVSLNRYAYAGNDPVNHVDIDGRSFWSKIMDGVVDGLRSFTNMIKAALRGDIKAIFTIIISLASIYVGGLALTAALKGVLGAGLIAQAGGSVIQATVTAMAEGSLGGIAAAAVAIGTAAAVGFGTGFAIGLVQTGSVKAALKAGVNAAISGALNMAINLAVTAFIAPNKWLKAGTNPKESVKFGDWDVYNGRFSKYASETCAMYAAATELFAIGHDPFMRMLDGLRTGDLTARVVYVTVNFTTALLGAVMTEGAIAAAFGKMGPTTAAILTPFLGSFSFFDIPKQPYPGVTREDIARASIEIRF